LPPAPKTLIACVAQEPESLFIYHPEVLYGEGSAVAHTILQAIYDGPIDLLNYGVEPVILDDLPTLENGGVTLQPVTLRENEVFFNPLTLQPENLRVGDRFIPGDCHAPDCLATYSGGEVEMDQMVVEFRLREGVVWSDGQPLTAADSRYSYSLDRSGELPTTKFLVDRTSDYRVLDERTIRWVGVPGFIDSDYMTNFWTPLPEHILGSYQVGELLDADAANRMPIGWGPYVMSAWEPGELTLIPNELYSSDPEHSPYYDQVTFRFLDRGGDNALQQILTDECDFIDETLLDPGDLPSAQSLQQDGRVAIWSALDAQIVRLDFNLSSTDSARPAFFQDGRTRRALAQCIDRSAIQAALIGTSADLPASYLGVGNPHLAEEVAMIPYDPEAGKASLEQIGWVLDEEQPESPRVAFGVSGVRMATPFSVSVAAADTEDMLEVAGLVAGDLEACGIETAVNAIPQDELAQPWPDGPIFGRQFDMVIWSWPDWISPLCEMFASWEIPSNKQPYGINASGFSSGPYDEACQKLLLSLPGTQGYQEAADETQRLLNESLPALPLYQPLRWVVSDTEMCGLEIDGTATSTLWNIEMLDSSASCP
jgi:peptide/nickel transport system substrate-binding protein